MAFDASSLLKIVSADYCVASLVFRKYQGRYLVSVDCFDNLLRAEGDPSMVELLKFLLHSLGLELAETESEEAEEILRPFFAQDWEEKAEFCSEVPSDPSL